MLQGKEDSQYVSEPSKEDLYQNINNKRKSLFALIHPNCFSSELRNFCSTLESLIHSPLSIRFLNKSFSNHQSSRCTNVYCPITVYSLLLSSVFLIFFLPEDFWQILCIGFSMVPRCLMVGYH